MYIETRSDYRKQHDIYNITNHLSASLSSNSDSDLLGIGVAETSGGEYHLISSKTSSDLYCVVFIINDIYL